MVVSTPSPKSKGELVVVSSEVELVVVLVVVSAPTSPQSEGELVVEGQLVVVSVN